MIRLIDANALLKSLKSGCENCSDANTNWCEHCCKINDFEDLIDNAPTVETKFELKTENGITYPNALDNMTFSHILSVEERQNIIQAYMLGANANARPQGTCKTCRCRNPEDKKCDCGALERQGCPFPVSDGYYCKYYEEGGAV